MKWFEMKLGQSVDGPWFLPFEHDVSRPMEGQRPISPLCKGLLARDINASCLWLVVGTNCRYRDKNSDF